MRYLYFESAMHNNPLLARQAQALFDKVGRELGGAFRPGIADELAQEPLVLFYAATGGTAGMMKAAAEIVRGNIVAVTSGNENSLSASMEFVTYLAQCGRSGILLHGNDNEVTAQIAGHVRVADAKKALSGLKIGLIGQPSDWLVSTAMDYNALREKTGIEIVEIDMEELAGEIQKGGYPDSDACRELINQDFDREELKKALDIYGALSRIVEKYNFDGVSVRCFDLLTSVRNTGCLGLSLLNSMGVYGGCEADLPSLISMVILGKLSGKPVFQCNPSRVDKHRNEIVFAHCTLPFNMPVEYRLETHFESDLGVAIRGRIPLGAATIFKASGDLSRHFVSSCEILENLNDPRLCRTQIRVKSEAPVEDFLQSHVGNHYLVCCGDYTGEIQAFFSTL